MSLAWILAILSSRVYNRSLNKHCSLRLLMMVVPQRSQRRTTISFRDALVVDSTREGSGKPKTPLENPYTLNTLPIWELKHPTDNPKESILKPGSCIPQPVLNPCLVLYDMPAVTTLHMIIRKTMNTSTITVPSSPPSQSSVITVVGAVQTPE